MQEQKLRDTRIRLKQLRRRIRELEGKDDVTAIHRMSALQANGQPDRTSQLAFKTNMKTNRVRGWTKARQLTDTGADTSFIHPAFIKEHGIKTYDLIRPSVIQLGDGEEKDQLTQAAEVVVRHGTHISTVTCFVFPTGTFDIILGMDWLDLHKPLLGFGEGQRSMTFNDKHCLLNCLHPALPETVYERGPPDSDRRPPTERGAIDMISGKAALAFMKRDPSNTIWIEPHDWDRLGRPPDPGGGSDDDCDAEAFKDVIAHKLAAVTTADFEKYMAKMEQPPMTDEEIRERLPDWLKSRFKAFSYKDANEIPARREGIDHAIVLTDDKKVPRPHIYGLTRVEAEAVKVYLEEMLAKGYIRPSTSPFAAPVLVAKKPGGGLRICIDYRALNALTVKNRNAPPAIKETLARLNKVRWLTIMDVIVAFNKVRIKEGDEYKTAFLTRWGLYEYVVMPLGLCNAPGTFQTLINETLRDLLDRCCTAYLDDVLVYSETEEQHERDVTTVIDRLHAAGLYLDIAKSKFRSFTKRTRGSHRWHPTSKS